MAFQIKEWLDRIVEHPTRRTITDTTTGVSQTVDVTRTEGEVTQEGTPLGAVTFNDLESRIATAFGEKQDTLIAGDNITIENNVISAAGGGTASNEFTLKLHIDENTEGLNSAIDLTNTEKLTFYRFTPSDALPKAMYRIVSPFSFSGDIYWECKDTRIRDIVATSSNNYISIYLKAGVTREEYEQMIADNPIILYLWENDIEETQRYYATRIDSMREVGYYENRFCYITEKTNKIENGYVDFVGRIAYDSTQQYPSRTLGSNFSIDSLVNRGYLINEIAYSTGTVELNYDGVNSYLNRKFEDQNAEIKEDLIQLDTNKLGRNYEQLVNVTLSEEISAFKYNFGGAYNDLIMIVTIPENITTPSNMWIGDEISQWGDNAIFYVNLEKGRMFRYHIWFVEHFVCSDVWQTPRTEVNKAYSSTFPNNLHQNNIKPYTKKSITGITFSTQHALPINTTIEIYGIKA